MRWASTKPSHHYSGKITFTNAQLQRLMLQPRFQKIRKTSANLIKTMIVFVFSKQSQIQNVNVVHVLVWHLQSTHRIRSWDCCLVGCWLWGGGAVDNPCHNERLGDMLLKQIGLTSIASAFQRDHVQWPSRAAKIVVQLATQIQHMGCVYVAKRGNLDHQCI